MKARLYYEAHITLDPAPEHERIIVQTAVQPFKFKLAKLLMDKGVPSTLDTFCTAHGQNYTDIRARTAGAVRALIKLGYNVRRYKIEDTLLDSRLDGDVLQVLESSK